MIRILPQWYTKVREEIESEISEQARKLNISGLFICDSKCIDECVDGIMNTLIRLKEEVRGEFNEEQLNQAKKLKEIIDKEEDKKNQNQIERNKNRYSITKRNRSINKKVQKK